VNNPSLESFKVSVQEREGDYMGKVLPVEVNMGSERQLTHRDALLVSTGDRNLRHD
jgi:hypothetical protein